MIIIKSELSGSGINGMIQALTNDIQDAQKLSISIDNFINEINRGHNLSGESYMKVRNKLIEYKDILSKRVNVATNLKSAIEQAVSKMITFMAEDPKLDDSGLEESKNSLANMQTNYNTLLEQIKVATTDTAKTDLERHLYQQSLSIQILKKEIEKREQLAPTDSYAYSSLETARSQIAGYDAAVNSINQSQTVTL